MRPDIQTLSATAAFAFIMSRLHDMAHIVIGDVVFHFPSEPRAKQSAPADLTPPALSDDSPSRHLAKEELERIFGAARTAGEGLWVKRSDMQDENIGIAKVGPDGALTDAQVFGKGGLPSEGLDDIFRTINEAFKSAVPSFSPGGLVGGNPELRRVPEEVRKELLPNEHEGSGAARIKLDELFQAMTDGARDQDAKHSDMVDDAVEYGEFKYAWDWHRNEWVPEDEANEGAGATSGPSVVLLGNHGEVSDGGAHPLIETYLVNRNCNLMVGVHRYGSGWAAALVPSWQADKFSALMDAGGSEPFVFSYAVEDGQLPEIPFQFGATRQEAMDNLEKALESDDVHDPAIYLEPLLEAVEHAVSHNSGELDWLDDYRQRYEDY